MEKVETMFTLRRAYGTEFKHQHWSGGKSLRKNFFFKFKYILPHNFSRRKLYNILTNTQVLIPVFNYFQAIQQCL